MSGSLQHYARNGWTIPVHAMTIVEISGRAQRRSEKTTNLDRIASDLLDDVLGGILTAHEADVAYGAGGKGGRSRTYPRFADYVAARIRYAESREVEGELLALLAKSVAPGPRTVKANETRLINKMLDETGRERAERLREVLAELGEHDANHVQHAKVMKNKDRLRKMLATLANPACCAA
jgi:hypothetical protein